MNIKGRYYIWGTLVLIGLMFLFPILIPVINWWTVLTVYGFWSALGFIAIMINYNAKHSISEGKWNYDEYIGTNGAPFGQWMFRFSTPWFYIGWLVVNINRWADKHLSTGKYKINNNGQ